MATVYRSASVTAARIAGESQVMDDVANAVADNARALAASHNVSGEFEASIGVERRPGKRGVTDRIVYADDPNALSIEFGHLTRPGKDGTSQHWVEGLHILARAAGVQ